MLAKRRLETEGILTATPKTDVVQKHKQYTEGFLHKLRIFFEL